MSPLVEPTLNNGREIVLSMNDGVYFTKKFNVGPMGWNSEAKSKGKGKGIAKDGSSPYKKCQITQNKKTRSVRITKVSTDVAKLWNELTNGLRSSNSLVKEDVNLVLQKKKT